MKKIFVVVYGQGMESTADIDVSRELQLKSVQG